jgi:hypothetical protein
VSDLNNLLVDTNSFDSLSIEQLNEISLSAECHSMNLGHGIAAIGNILACAALNKDTGLNMDVVADLGWLIETLGNLSSKVTDIENCAAHYRSRKAQGKAQGART